MLKLHVHQPDFQITPPNPRLKRTLRTLPHWTSVQGGSLVQDPVLGYSPGSFQLLATSMEQRFTHRVVRCGGTSRIGADCGCVVSVPASPGPIPPPVEDPAPDQSTGNDPVLDVPDFPDFDHSVGEAPNDPKPVDIASLELEDLEFVNFDLPPPVSPVTSYFEAALVDCASVDPASFDLQGLDLHPDSQEDSVAHEPAGVPESRDLTCLPWPVAPESWCGQGEDTAEPPPVPEHGSAAAAAAAAAAAGAATGEADPGASEAYSSTEEYAALANGIEAQPR